MVITESQVYTTISEDKFNVMRKRVTALRRMSMERLLALCHTHYTEFHSEYMQNKGDTFPFIMQAEFGWQAVEAYHNEVARRAQARKAQGRRGQLRLPIA